MDHLGVEVDSTEAVHPAAALLGEAGLATDVGCDTTRCQALQDKVWVHGPGQEPWEVYVVKADADTPAKREGGQHLLRRPSRHRHREGTVRRGRPLLMRILAGELRPDGGSVNVPRAGETSAPGGDAVAARAHRRPGIHRGTGRRPGQAHRDAARARPARPPPIRACAWGSLLRTAPPDGAGPQRAPGP